jgi:hypothetical protein
MLIPRNSAQDAFAHLQCAIPIRQHYNPAAVAWIAEHEMFEQPIFTPMPEADERSPTAVSEQDNAIIER